MFRPANFTWSLITLVLLCSNAVPAYDFYNPENQASERLEKLKLALVDYALDNGFKVNASAWLDENGAVAEDVYLVSTLNLESLRFDEVTNEFGYPEDAIVEVAFRVGYRDHEYSFADGYDIIWLIRCH